MKIVIAPDSYKESLTAMEVATAIEAGFRQAMPDADYYKLPMADGGEGTVQALIDASGGSIITKRVTGPLGEQVDSFFGLMGSGNTAVIEMAAASGLHLVPLAQRNPMLTTSWLVSMETVAMETLGGGLTLEGHHHHHHHQVLWRRT